MKAPEYGLHCGASHQSTWKSCTRRPNNWFSACTLLTLSSNCHTHFCVSCASKPSHCMLLVVDLPRGSHQACNAALSRGDCNFLCDPCSLRICSVYPDQACRTGSETQMLHDASLRAIDLQSLQQAQIWRSGGHFLD